MAAAANTSFVSPPEAKVKILRIGIVGAGRMGRLRAASADQHPRCEVAGIADSRLPQAQLLASEFGCMATKDWTQLVSREDLDVVVVATPPKYSAAISAAALQAGKHVFCEKPGARAAAEVEKVLRALHGAWPPVGAVNAASSGKYLAPQFVMGFTLRHHPAIARARHLLAGGEIGRPMYVLGRYGHGGRPGYAQEWRAQRDLAGGGELLDQGVHLIDLSRWFLGEFAQVTGTVDAYFWRPDPPAEGDPLEDNAFLLLRSAQGFTASLQASWTQWKNHFGFEVYGENGFLQVQGLGGSYGEEKLLMGRRNPEGGSPEIKEIRLSGSVTAESHDDVWALEWQAFINALLGEELHAGVPPASAYDAWQALRIVEAVYEASRTGATLPLNHLGIEGSHSFTQKVLATSNSI